MPIDDKRYPKNWQEIAIETKNAADWQCQHCRRHCLRPGEKGRSASGGSAYA